MSSLQDHVRRTQALEAQFGRLHGQVGVLKGHVKGIQPGISLNQIPAWDVVRMSTTGALAGDDWDPLFDDESADSRIQHSLRTAGGEISHVNSDSSATRLRIRFTGQGEGQVAMKLGVVGTGTLQVKANGDIQPYTAGAFINFKLLSPPLTNELVVCADGSAGPFQFSLDGLLFDGVNRHWVSY
jgi:hypothetical protein